MLHLRYFRYSDYEVLQKKFLPGSSEEDVIKTLDFWNMHRYNDMPFEKYAICENTIIIGTLSLFLHDDLQTVSIEPEILPEFRRKGYAKAAMQIVFRVLRSHEFWHVTAQIRKDDIAGIRLHESLGYSLCSEAVNDEGNEVFIYKMDL